MSLQAKQPNLLRGSVSKCSPVQFHQTSLYKEFSHLIFITLFCSSFLYHLQLFDRLLPELVSVMYKIKPVIPLLTWCTNYSYSWCDATLRVPALTLFSCISYQHFNRTDSADRTQTCVPAVWPWSSVLKISAAHMLLPMWNWKWSIHLHT